MQVLVLSAETLQLIERAILPGYGVASARARVDGAFEISVDDEVIAHIDAARCAGETDDGVVGRLVRSALGAKPN